MGSKIFSTRYPIGDIHQVLELFVSYIILTMRLKLLCKSARKKLLWLNAQCDTELILYLENIFILSSSNFEVHLHCSLWDGHGFMQDYYAILNIEQLLVK